MFRRLTVLIVLLAFAQAPAMVSGQAPGNSGSNHQNPASTAHSGTPSPAAPRANAPQGPGKPASNPGGDNGSSSYQQPQIIVTSPPAAPAPVAWTWHDRVAWGAAIILAVLGYIGILLALRTLKSIERHTESGVTAAQAALESANAALAQTQALANSERPWVAISIEPFLTMENSFKVVATNRGRTPARIMATIDQIFIAADETQLPPSPAFEGANSSAPPDPMILLPGESAGIRAFGREGVRTVCKTSETLKRIELWQESIFLYGRVTYRDMITPPDQQTHETDWCCRYIHGEKSSAMVMAGPPEYNKHT